MGTRVSLQTSLQINSLCFSSGKIFNIIFLVENNDNMLQHWSPPCIGHLQTTDYCVRMVIILSSIDESLIQAHEYSRTPHFSILDPWLSILDARFLRLETRTSRPSRRENRVSRIESRLSTYLRVVLYGIVICNIGNDGCVYYLIVAEETVPFSMLINLSRPFLTTVSTLT